MINNNKTNSKDTLTQIDLKSAFDIYNDEIYPDGQSIMCSIHDSFHKPEDKAHNCIGCNFASFTQLLRTSLEHYVEAKEPLEAFSSAILYSYLLVERFEEVFKIIRLHESYKHKHFQIFGKIKRWTNFLKHPKAFILVHHPVYYFEDEITIAIKDKSEITIINQDFIDMYYSGDAKNSKLYSILTNKKDVYVIFPKLADIITKFCVAQKKFINLISRNEVFREILNGQTTLKDYFEELDEEIEIT